MVNVTAEDTWVWWAAGGPWSTLASSQFHAQIKRQDQLWEVGAHSSGGFDADATDALLMRCF